MRLHNRLFLFFVVMVILPLLVVTVAMSIILQRSASTTYQARLQSGLAAASASITQQAQALSDDLQVAMARIDTAALGSTDPQAQAAALAKLVAESSADGAVILDRDGVLLASAGLTASADGSPLLNTPVHLQGAVADWQLVLYRQYDQQAIADIFASLELEWALLEGSAAAAGSLPPGTDMRGLDDHLAAARAAVMPESFIETGVAGRDVMAAVMPLPERVAGPGVVLYTAVPAETVSAAADRALAVGMVSLLLVTVVAVVLGLAVARSITRPLRELTRTAAAGVEGHLGERIEAGRQDEVGSLASSLGLMQEGIRRHITDLEESRTQMMLALTYAGDILGSTSDRRRLMKTTAEAARLATGARAVWVELFEPRKPGEEAISTGVPPAFFDGEAGRQAGRLAVDTAAGRTVTGEICDFSDAAEALAFPLVHNREVLGSLVAVFDRDCPPEESCRKILGSLAVQAASAMENISFSELQRQLAVTDPMTGLYNFRYLREALDKELGKSQRYRHELAVAIIDLDDFKVINDTYGHHAGDESLKAVAAVLQSRVRNVDIAARYGGEEFAVVFPETGKAPAMKVAESLRADIAAIRLDQYPAIRITASIGLAGYPADGDEAVRLLRRADEALYAAKKAGKNRCIAS